MRDEFIRSRNYKIGVILRFRGRCVWAFNGAVSRDAHVRDSHLNKKRKANFSQVCISNISIVVNQSLNWEFGRNLYP